MGAAVAQHMQRENPQETETWTCTDECVSRLFRFPDRSTTLSFASRVGHLMLEHCLPELRIGECSCEVVWAHRDGSCQHCEDHVCSSLVQDVYQEMCQPSAFDA